MNRFSRQSILPGFGTAGQEKLSRARVLVIGAGGLGCPILLHLGAAGVGTLGIADGDFISESNLNRQTLFGTADVGKPKAATAAEVLLQKYPDIKVAVFPEFLNSKNALKVIEHYDLVVDGSDNFGTRYMINDACVLLKKPLIMGAVFQYEGQLAVFNYGSNPINYRDLHSEPPKENEIPNCAETGVLGVLPAMIGVLQATEAIKLISGVGKVLQNKLLYYDLRNTSFFEVEVPPDFEARKEIPTDRSSFEATDYSIKCGAVEAVNWQQALDWVQGLQNSLMIDVRALGEVPEVEIPGLMKIPKEELEKHPEKLAEAEQLFLFCRSGVRSQSAALFLKGIFPEKKIFSIEGGILDASSPLNSEYYGAKT